MAASHRRDYAKETNPGTREAADGEIPAGPSTRAAGETCLVCMYAYQPTQDPEILTCRRFPPGVTSTGGYAQPPVTVTTWCGYYMVGVPELPPAPLPPPATLVPPVNVDGPYIAQDVNTISCTMGNWDGEPLRYEYDWRMDETDVGPGYESANYIVVSPDIGRTATCIVTAFNDGGQTSVTSNAIVVTDPALYEPPAPPTSVSPPVINQDAVTQLDCSTGEWTGEPTVYTYAWTIAGVPVEGTEAYHVIDPSEVGDIAICTVTATNAVGAGTGQPSATFPINPIILGPVNTGAPLCYPSGASMMTTTGSWADPVPTIYRYQWFVDSVPMPGATSANYPYDIATQAGLPVFVEVTAENAEGGVTMVPSNLETIPASQADAESRSISERTAKRRAKASLDDDEDDKENDHNGDKPAKKK